MTTDESLQEPRAAPRRKGIYILPNLFTLAALFGGFYAIVMAMNGRFEQAAIGVFCAMVLDSLDGRVARMTNTQSAFGEQMDSLSDMVSLRRRAGADRLRVGAQGPGQAGLDRGLRLLRLRRAAPGALQHQHRRGRQALLPGPAQPGGGGAGGGLHLGDGRRRLQGRREGRWLAWTAFAFTLYAGLTMVTNVPFYSFKDVSFKRSVPFVVIVAIALGIAVINIHPPGVLFGLFVVYGLSGYGVYVWKRMKGRPVSVIATSTDEPDEQGLHR